MKLRNFVVGLMFVILGIRLNLTQLCYKSIAEAENK